MSISCSRCNADAIAFTVPPALREVAPVETDAATCCRVCLTIDPLDERPADGPSLSVVTDALDRDAETAAAVVVLIGLLESLALHRRDIQAVVDYLEAEGVDALLVLEEVAADPTLTPAVDLDRRLHQLQQLLE